MNQEKSKQMFRVHNTVEYIKHLIDCGDSFHWEPEDIEQEIYSVLAYYGIADIDKFTSESLAMIKDELLQLCDDEQDREIQRIYAVEIEI